jgi:glutathione S-transferase
VLEHDLSLGGRYRFAFRFPDGAEAVVRGEFLTIQRPSRLVFTRTWEEPDPHAGIETIVSIVLTDTGGGTEILVTHERFPEASVRNRHDEGWSTTLDRLEGLLSQEGDGS